MQRPKYFQQRDILIVTDYPTVDEEKHDNFWGAASHLELLTDLARVGIEEIVNLGSKQEPILKTQIAYTHLSYKRPAQDNSDFLFSFSKTEYHDEETFYQIPWEKKLFCAEHLWAEVQGLLDEIRQTKPKFIIVAGKWALYFLSGRVPFNKTQGTKVTKKPLGGLSSHRGSITPLAPAWGLPETVVYPVLPFSEKWRTLNDQRVKTEKAQTVAVWDWVKFSIIFNSVKSGAKSLGEYLNPWRSIYFGTKREIIDSFFDGLMYELSQREVFCSVDIESRHWLIDCIGFSYKPNVGFCLPISTIDNPVPWTLKEEMEIVDRIRKAVTHPNFRAVFQNGSYDIKEIFKAWGIWVEPEWDTMLAAHVLRNTQKKSLDFIASINVTDYQFWKDMQSHEEEELAK